MDYSVPVPVLVPVSNNGLVPVPGNIGIVVKIRIAVPPFPVVRLVAASTPEPEGATILDG